MTYIFILIIKARTLVNLLAKIQILVKYLDYSDIFLLKFAAKFLDYNNNNYNI